jgi:hypothetical protein
VLLNNAKVVERRLVLNSGVSYSVLVLQDYKTLSVRLLSKVKEVAEQGLAIVGERPLRSPGLTNDQSEFAKLADELWNGKIISGKSMETVLTGLKVVKDFTFTSLSGDAPITYIHRRIDDADVYFIANQRRTTERLVCDFRVSNREPEFWNPVTGKTHRSRVYKAQNGFVTVPVNLDPSGSLFVVFRNAADVNAAIAIENIMTPVVRTDPFQTTRRVPTETNNFTITFWAKPENSIMISTNNYMDGQLPWTDFYALYPSPGAKLYGAGHSTMGLAVGRNGLAVWENENGRPEFNSSIATTISGWAKIELRCTDRVPSLYINDKLVLNGNKSRYNNVHPATGHAYLNEGASFFNGDMKTTMETPVNNLLIEDGDRMIAFDQGSFTVRKTGGKASTIKVPNGETIDLLKDWTITFPENSGAPKSIRVPELQSLHLNSDNGVKYFSGTCVYSKTFKVSKKNSKKEDRYILDLGVVELIAEVFVNDRSLGVLWTRPFVTDITDYMIEGDNKLAIHVTNLWPNRLIGDEQAPEVYNYVPGGGGFGFASLSRGAIVELPEWYKRGEPKPNDGRVAFATWKHYVKDSPLLQSGLVGPVAVRKGTVINIG